MSSINKIKTNDITYDVEDTSKQGLLIPGDNITIENNVISAQNSYVLPVAGENTLGGVKVGENLSIDMLGKLSSKNFNILLKNVVGNIPAIVQSGDKYYKPSTNKIYTYISNAWDEGVEPSIGVNYINQDDNRIYLYNGTTLKLPVDPYTLPIASSVQLGGVMVGSNLSITGTGVLNATDTTYTAGDNISINSSNVISTPDSVKQVSTVPTANADNLNKIIQFVGTTDSTYTNGYFYKCVSDGALEPTYSWELLSVQPAPAGAHITLIDKTADSAATVLDKLKVFYDNYLNNKEFIVYIYNLEPNLICSVRPDYTYSDSSKLVLTGLYDSAFRNGGAHTTSYGVTYSMFCGAKLTINLTNGEPSSYLIESFSDAVGYLPTYKDSVLGISNNTSWTPQGDYNPATKKYVDDNTLKRATMPVASSSNLGAIYQYTGATTSNYTNGYFYQCISDGATTPTYSWERIDVQPGADQAHITIIDKRTESTTTILDKLKTYYANYLENKEYALYIDSPTNGSVGIRCTFVPDPTFGISATKLCLSGLINPSYRSGGSYATEGYGVKYSYCQIVVLTINISNGVPTSYTISTPSVGSVVGYLPYGTGSLLGMSNTTAWTPSGDYNPATKKYVDDNVLKRSTLPVASSSNIGTIYQYTGTTNQNYTNGYFYQSVSDGANPATYSWERIDVQPQPTSSDPGVPTYYVSDNGNSYTHFKVDQKPAITNILNYVLAHNGNLPNAYFASSCGSAFLVQTTFTEATGYVSASLYFRGIVKRYNSDMGDGLSTLYSGLSFTVYLDPTEYANGELTTVYFTSALSPSEYVECGWDYGNATTGKVVQSGTTLLYPQDAVNKLTYSSNIPSGTNNVYLYTGEVPNQQNYKYGHIYHCVNNPTLGRNEMVELKQATDSFEILMYDGTTSSDSANTVNKYYNNIKNGIPSVLLLVTDQYPSGSGSATSATGKMIVPMSLDTTNPWSSTYRACLVGAAVSYDATGVYHAKQVLRFQDDTVTGLYTLQWKAPDGGSSGMSLTEWFQRSGLSEYSSSSTYNVGDFVYYSNQIYVCDTAIAVAESWDSTKWTQITYLDYLNRVLVGNALGGSY